jgi:hypothetical protein
MARLRTRAAGDRQWVTISGHLTGRDLGRLERLCAGILEEERLRLTLRLAAGVELDDAARAYMERLARRGATVLFD